MWVRLLRLLQEMPADQYQLALCRAKSMVAPLTPLKVHFKNIENHARKALLAPPILTDDPWIRHSRKWQKSPRLQGGNQDLMRIEVTVLVVLLETMKVERHNVGYSTCKHVVSFPWRWSLYLSWIGWRRLWWSCWSGHRSLSGGERLSRAPPPLPPSHSDI